MNIFYKELRFSKILFASFILSLGIFYFGNISSVQAATTYYVDATGGLDANNGTATSTAWKTIAKVNGFTFAAGDSILFKRGETWNEQLTIPRAGTAGNPMTFDAYGATGAKPIIDGQSTRDYCITFGALSYITINNIQVQNGKVRNIWSDGAASGITLDGIDSIGGAVGIYIRDKSSSTYRNITVSTTTGTSYAYGFALQNAASNVVVDNITVTGANSSTGDGIYLGQITNLTAINLTARKNGRFGIYLIECGGTLTASNLTAGGGPGLGNSGAQGIYIQSPTTISINITNATSSYNTAVGFQLATVNAPGTIFTIDNLISEHNGSTGVAFYGKITTSTIQNSISRYNGGSGDGFWVGTNAGTDPNGITFNNCIANNNNWDGFSFTGAGSNFTISKSISFNNGTVGQAASGDGFTSHNTITNLNIYNSISYDNLNSGFAFTGSSSGSVYNSTFYNNGSGAFTRGGFWIAQMTGGSGWTIKNNIFSNNYPYEVILDASSLAYQTANNNLYYHPADNKFATLDYGATNITWTTYHTTNGYETNSLYQDPLLKGVSSSDFHPNFLSPAIDSGTDDGATTTDYAGLGRYDDPFTTNVGGGTNKFYDIGAYEFLGINSGATNTVDSNGAITYSSYPSSTSTSKALKITPSASSVDVAIDTWNTTNAYYKKWTESSASSTITTAHIIGDLRANQHYQVKVGGTVLQTSQANTSGTISFTYSGGYSTKIFEVEEIPTAPIIVTPTVLSSSAIRWNFTDNADNETGFRVYTNADAIATSSATANLTYLDETGLSENTQYTRYVKAYNSYGESASSSATSTYTLVDTPTGFNFITHPTSLDLYVDGFPNSNIGSSGYLFWRTDNSAYNSGWIQTREWRDPNMVEGQTYTYAVKYRNGDGVETATTTMGGVSFTRDNGGGGTPTIPQQTTSTSSVQATATLSNATSTIQATSTQATSSVSFEKLISQMSREELIAKINQITQMIAQLQSLLGNSLSTIPNTFSFKDTLKQGITDIAVKYLQIILNQDPNTQVAQIGVGSSGKETNYFGLLTKQAVIKFQEKYKDTILKPWGLTKSTGFVGKTTRDKLNSLLGN